MHANGKLHKPWNNASGRDVHKAVFVETDTFSLEPQSPRPRPRHSCQRPRRDRGISNSSRGEAETKAFRARDQDKAETFVSKTEAFVCGAVLRVAAVA